MLRDETSQSTGANRSYLEGLDLTHKDLVDTLVQFLWRRIRVGNLISPADLFLQAILEVGLSLLVLVDFVAQVPNGLVDLGLNARITGTGCLLESLDVITEAAETGVDVILNVVESLARGLVFLVCA